MCRWDGGDEELVLVVDACDKAGEATNAEVDEAAPMATAAAVAANDFMLIIIAVYFGSVACGWRRHDTIVQDDTLLAALAAGMAAPR